MRFVSLVTSAILGAAVGFAAPARPPNIVLIFADDLGHRDTGFTGSTYCETPHLDRLAAHGMVFNHAYAAAAFMEKNRDRPFFAFVSHHAIHSALEARPASLAKFQAKTSAAPGQKNALYAACLYDLDENTLVIFTSDNGGTGQSSQEPLRGNKGCYYDGGIREPFIATWPGRIAPGMQTDVPIINVDLYPTFLAVAGAAAPAGKILDGESLLPLFTRPSAALARPAIFWRFPGYLDDPVTRGRDPVFRTRPVTVMRAGDWKLHLYHEEWQLDGGREKLATNRAVELYNLAVDPGERTDLSVSNPKKRDELLDELLAWIDRTGAKLPTVPTPAYLPEK